MMILYMTTMLQFLHDLEESASHPSASPRGNAPSPSKSDHSYAFLMIPNQHLNDLYLNSSL